MQAMLEQRNDRHANKHKSRHRKGHYDLRGKGIRIRNKPKHIAKQQKHKKRKDEWEIGAAFAADIASYHFGNKFIHHFCHALHAAWNHIGPAHRADQKNGTDANGKQHKQAGIGE